MVFEIQAFLCFAIFTKNSKWPPFLEEQKFFEHWVSRVTLWVKYFIEIALSSTVFEIQALLCFAFLKIFFENSKWLPFLASEIFVETWKG